MIDEHIASSDDFLLGGGNMGALVRAIDWSRTPLGPTSTWPQSLRTTVSSCLNSRFPILVWWGPELVKIYNDAYRPMLGAKHPASLGAPGRAVWPEIWHIIGPMLEGVMREGRATWSENQFLPLVRHGFAEECYFTFSYSPIRDESGGVGGVLCAVTETTGQVIGERRLQLLQELAAHTAGARTEQDACDRVMAQLATDPADLPFALLYVDAGDGQSLKLAGATGVAVGTDASPLSIGVRPDDPARRCWNDGVLLLPVFAEEGPAAGLLVAGLSPKLALDDRYRGFVGLIAGHIGAALSRARAFEAERRRAEALAELDRAKTAFFSNVSHEFRTPLTLMLGPTEDALASPDQVLRGADLETVHRNELRLLKLVNALLDFSRIEAGRMQAAYEPVDLASLTADIASMFRAATERAGLTFTVACDEITGPVYVDRAMWEKILLNLLSNALKFTFDGGISVELRDRGERVELRVRDTGTGIPAADLPRVFDRFHRVDGAKGRTQEGSGIGLALVHELVRLNGATIAVESAPGAGSTFTVALAKGTAHVPGEQLRTGPSSAPSTAAAAFVHEALRWSDRPAPSTAAADESAGAGGHVLVADDNADMREYLTRVLQPHWRVDAVADGAAALEAVHRHAPDVIVTDVMMPNVGGFELLRALREGEATAAIPVIMLSAQAGEEARIGALQRGADDYLVKPFSARELVARVHNQVLLARHAGERARLLEGELAARREAESQRQQLYALFMQAPTPILILRGPEHVIELINPITCTLWGRRHEEVIGRPLFDAVPELRGQVFKDLLTEVYRSGTAYVGTEVPARLDPQGDGNERLLYFNFVYSPVQNRRGEIDGIFVIASDVTPQVVARNEMARLRAEAESANRAKDEFLAMLGHELRNPLAPIMTALQLMRLRDDPGSERERDVIERQVSHLTQLVDDLLDVSRIARGKIDLNRERLAVEEVVARAIEVASPLLEQRRHVLEVQVPRGELAVDGDASRLRQIVSNLLTNAAKYTEPGGRIAISAGREGDDLLLRVRDTGIGIDAAMLPHIFELFVQERQAVDRAHGGLGIGLTIVRNLVALHGGSVSVHSDGLGAGSEFVVRLPLAVSDTTTMAPAAAVATARTAPLVERQHSLRVLVVDDNVDAARMLGEALTFVGHDIRIAHDGITALGACEGFEPDVALVDIGLPVMDGYELAERLRTRAARRIRLIAITGYGQETDRQRSRACGFDEHLVKPIDIDRLERIIEEIEPSSS